VGIGRVRYKEGCLLPTGKRFGEVAVSLPPRKNVFFGVKMKFLVHFWHSLSVTE